jgi:hypothetical protein
MDFELTQRQALVVSLEMLLLSVIFIFDTHNIQSCDVHCTLL